MTSWDCPNGCRELLAVYECELGVYLGCAECLWMSDPRRAEDVTGEAGHAATDTQPRYAV
jgi:hypothetical protein